MKRLHLLSTIAVSIALSACVTTGGGISPDKLTRPIRADDKPYIGELDAAHSKTSMINQYHPMKPVWEWEIYTARTGNFTKDDSATLFAAPLAYRTWGSSGKGDALYPVVSPKTAMTDPAYWSPFSIWHVDPKTNEPDKKIIDLGIGCLHPRRAIVADFNQDGIDDVYVPCHGHASEGISERIPGEKSRMVMSDGKGGFKNSEFGVLGLWHGGAAADVNGDDYPDIVGADMGSDEKVFFYINQKDGTFKKDTSKIIGGLQNWGYATVEMFDVDGDGIVDLLVGGHEFEGTETAVLFGDQDGKFGSEKLAIPKVPGRGVILQYIPVTNSGERVLYVIRAADSTTKIGWYNSRTVQAVNLTTGKSTLAYDHELKMGGHDGHIYAIERGLLSGWLPATRNGQKGITPADARHEELFIADGKLVESK